MRFRSPGFISLSCFVTGFWVGAITFVIAAVRESAPMRSDPPIPCERRFVPGLRWQFVRDRSRYRRRWRNEGLV